VVAGIPRSNVGLEVGQAASGKSSLAGSIASGTIDPAGVSAALSRNGKDYSGGRSGDTLGEDQLGGGVEKCTSVSITLLDQELESNAPSSSGRGTPVELGEEGLDAGRGVSKSTLAGVSRHPRRGVELRIGLLPITNTLVVLANWTSVSKKTTELVVVVLNAQVKNHQFSGLVARYISRWTGIASAEGVGGRTSAGGGSAIKSVSLLGAKGPWHDTGISLGTV